MSKEKIEDSAIARTIRKFNPGLLQSDDEIVGQFVVRQHEFELVRDVLVNNIDTPSCQHVLVVAPRGHGKTMLLARVAAEVRRDEELDRHLLPVRFIEENQEIDGLADFWLETLYQLAREVSAKHHALARELLKTHADLSERWREQGMEGLAQAAVLDAADRLNRRLVLLVENMQSLLSNMDEEFGWKLRSALQSLSQIILVASATSRFEELADPSAPFFELFHCVYLKSLSPRECLRLWTEITDQSPDTHEIRPLQILTGGNPRLLVMVAEFAHHRSLRQLMEEIVCLIDENTDYFRGNLESLPTKERRVFVSLIDLWQASSAGEISVRARLDVRVVSTMLGRLVERGAVTIVTDSKGGKRLYAAAERLYSIYYKLRREGDEASVVEALVHFMVVFYDVGEVHRVSDLLMQEALESSAIQLGIDRALVSRLLLKDGSLDKKWDEIRRVSDLTKNKLYTNAATKFRLDVAGAYDNENWKRVLEIVDQYEADQPTDILWMWERKYGMAHRAHLRTEAHLRLKEYHKVIEVAGEAVERLRDTQDTTLMSKAYSMGLNVAKAYYHLGDFKRSRMECDLLLEYYENCESPWNDTQLVLALVFKAESETGLGNDERATNLLDKVLERFGHSDALDVQRLVARSMVGHGEIAQVQYNAHQRAIETYSKTISHFGGSDDIETRILVKSAWLNRGIAHGMLGDFESEIDCYEELVAWIDKRNAPHERPSALTALIYKSRRLAELGRAEEALASCKDSAERLEVCGSKFEADIRQWIDWYMGGTRALALVSMGESYIAMDSLRRAYNSFDPCDDSHVGEMLRLVPELISARASERELVDVLQSDTSRAQRLFPMIVALQQRQGESVRAPEETLGVAEDFRTFLDQRIAEGLMPGFMFRMDL